MAFQIVDDVLDYGGSAASMGKNVGDDFREGKVTLPVLLAVAAAGAEDRPFWTRVIEKRRQTDEDLPEALRLMAKTGALAASEARARDYAAEAREALAAFPPSDLRDALSDVVEFVVARLDLTRRRPRLPGPAAPARKRADPRETRGRARKRARAALAPGPGRSTARTGAP